jgi:hypothetical protein
MVTANWNGFGLPVNTHVQVDVKSGQSCFYWYVGTGKI